MLYEADSDAIGLKIYRISPEDPDVGDLDPYVALDQADEVFRLAEIRINRAKNITILAVLGEQVIGAVATAWQENRDEDAWEFSWDIAVHPEYRKSGIGARLIREALAAYESEKADYGDRTVMRLWVVNPRLANVLEQHYGFEIESELGHGQKIMTKY
jgi:ribosomal protein S18 acetylase RimI-like enzyme